MPARHQYTPGLDFGDVAAPKGPISVDPIHACILCEARFPRLRSRLNGSGPSTLGREAVAVSETSGHPGNPFDDCGGDLSLPIVRFRFAAEPGKVGSPLPSRFESRPFIKRR